MGLSNTSQHRDSVDKIVARYFVPITRQPFEYKGTTYYPKTLQVSSSIFIKRMECLEKCGACCFRFSLDYLPKDVPDELKESLVERKVLFNGREVAVFSDFQKDHEDHFCRHLNKENGRCGIHTYHPFSCDFELLRFQHLDDPNRPDHLRHMRFGRAWNMKRIDGEKGALCRWYESPCSREWIDEIIRRLVRLEEWATHFGIVTHLPTVIRWIDKGPHPVPLKVGPPTRGGFDLG